MWWPLCVCGWMSHAVCAVSVQGVSVREWFNLHANYHSSNNVVASTNVSPPYARVQAMIRPSAVLGSTTTCELYLSPVPLCLCCRENSWHCALAVFFLFLAHPCSSLPEVHSPFSSPPLVPLPFSMTFRFFSQAPAMSVALTTCRPVIVLLMVREKGKEVEGREGGGGLLMV